MVKKINCKSFKNGGYCTNKKIKRSLFGIGARCCVEYYDEKLCIIKEEHPRPIPPPPPPKKKLR
jgi:hypothetical protein